MANKKNCQNSGKKLSGKLTNMLNKNDRKVLLQLKQNPEGLRAETIRKLTGIPQRTLYRVLNKFSVENERKLIEKVGIIWKKANGESEFWQTLSESNEIFELHNLSYVLKLMKTPDWWKRRKSRLMKLKGWQFSMQNFGKNNSNPYEQIMNENFVIQSYPESIIIMHRKRYYSEDPYEVIQQGMSESIELIRFLEERFRFKFFPDGIPSMEIRGNDFNRLNDYIAKYCKKKGNLGFLVKTNVGDVWVDFSKPYGKEASTPDLQDTLEKYTKDLAENKPKLNSELELEIETLRNEMLVNKRDSLLQDKDISESNMDLRMVIKQMNTNINGLTETVYQLVSTMRKDWKD